VADGLLGRLGQALTLHDSGQRRVRELEAEWRHVQDADGPEVVGESEATRELGETLNRLLPSTTRTDAPPVLVTGESGTGKELVARYLHQLLSETKPRTLPRVQLRRDAWRPGRVEAVRARQGAFTGAITDAPASSERQQRSAVPGRGRELPADGQASSWRVLETRTVQAVGETKVFPVDVQIILATTGRSRRKVAAKRFVRTSTTEFTAPGGAAPLRDRGDPTSARC